MAYVEEFRNQLTLRDYSKIIELWHEYCEGTEQADGHEIIEILELIKQSDFAKPFGQCVDSILPLAMKITDDKLKLNVLKIIFDLQTTNSEELYKIASDILKSQFAQDPTFNEKIRLVGMRDRENFQGVLSNYFLLNHIKKGNFVLHTAGWGVGEIMDCSVIREQVSIEFENLQGSKRDISFKNAFKTLVPLESTHFLARRFADADTLEAEARNAPVEFIRMLLKDVGPKTATEIKDLVADLVIPEDDYSKWWQQTRGKLKKDALIESPENPKSPFYLRKETASSPDRLQKAFKGKHSGQDVITAAHTLVRDFPEVLKSAESKEEITSKIKALILQNSSTSITIQAQLFLENPLGDTSEQAKLTQTIQKLKSQETEEILQNIEVAVLKKRALTLIQSTRSDWAEIFLHLLFTIEPNQLKDFIYKELSGKKELEKQIQELEKQPKKYPEAVVWYFQKIINQDADFFTDAEGKGLFFEAFLILFASLDGKPEYRDLSKKIYGLLTSNRFEVVRNFLKEAPLHYVSEFLLLASKCRGFSDHEQKILRSLAEVVYPELAKPGKKAPAIDLNTIWTTQEGYMRTHERIKQIGTVEMVENAKEIEIARAHGDLRENAEYKAAQERRARLQSELKMLSDQFRHARIITKEDINTDEVSIGVTVSLNSANGQNTVYTVLGPWDANPDKAILSFQSKFVQTMLGKKKGESFSFKDDTFTIAEIKSYLDA